MDLFVSQFMRTVIDPGFGAGEVLFFIRCDHQTLIETFPTEEFREIGQSGRYAFGKKDHEMKLIICPQISPSSAG